MPTKYEMVKRQVQKKPLRWAISGVAGFIGSNLLEQLLKLDQRVTGVDNFLTGYRRNLEDVRSLVTKKQWARFRFFEGDIRKLGDCRKACQGADFVLHQAALGSVPRSLKVPLATHEHNITGTLNMLVAARDCGVKRLVYASSSSAYGDHPGLPKVESRIGNPLSPYAVTKYVNELYAGVFFRCYGLESIGLRYFNVFGPRQDPGGAYAAVIPRWIRQLRDKERPVIYGDGKTSRDFCYVDNAVQANILAAVTENKKAVNEVYNVSVGNKTTLDDLFFMIRSFLTMYDEKIKNIRPIKNPFRPGDIRHSQANISKAKTLLGYRPLYTVLTGMKQTIQWFIAR